MNLRLVSTASVISCFAAAAFLFVGLSSAGEEPPARKPDANEQPHSTQDAAPAAPQAGGSPYLQAVRPADDESAEQATVFTNDDLDRLFRGRRPQPDADAGKPGPGDEAAPTRGEPVPEELDPLEWMNQRNAREADRRRLVAEAEARVTSAEARIKTLERRILAVRNPLLARPEIPDKESADWDSRDSRGRVEMSEQQIVEARKELADARAELARLGGLR